MLGQATVFPSVQHGNRGDTVTFTCNVSGVPSENITWARQLTAEKIVNSSQYLITSGANGSSQLTIKDITIDNQAGYYVCDGTANVDQPNSATCYLQVQCKFIVLWWFNFHESSTIIVRTESNCQEFSNPKHLHVTQFFS